MGDGGGGRSKLAEVLARIRTLHHTTAAVAIAITTTGSTTATNTRCETVGMDEATAATAWCTGWRRSSTAAATATSSIGDLQRLC